MAISNAQSLAFIQNFIRLFADRLAQDYDAAVTIINYWNANGGAGISPPTNPVATPSASGGTLPAGLKGYKVSALNAKGETLTTAEFTCTTTGATGSVALSWTAAAGATSYNIYARTVGSELLLTNVAASPFTDTGSISPGSATPPTSNTTGLVPNDSETVSDNTSPQITGIVVNNLINRATDIKNLMEGSVSVATNDGSKSVLNTILAASSHPSSSIGA